VAWCAAELRAAPGAAWVAALAAAVEAGLTDLQGSELALLVSEPWHRLHGSVKSF
jgi:hypothetical protein